VTTGKFSPDAKEAAQPSQNMRAVDLIDGEMLIDVCKRHQIGVKKKQLPKLMVLDIDPELTGGSGPGERPAEDGSEGSVPDDTSILRRLRDEMLGDSERGLSAEEVAELSGYALSTVRAYLSDDRRKLLGRAIRENEQKRTQALQMVSQRRGLERDE
jgi:hypothetical protein